jgi:WD40 repeat protein
MAYIDRSLRRRSSANAPTESYAPVRVVSHFFSNSSSGYRDPERALRSLCAQLRLLEPTLGVTQASPADQLRELLRVFPERLLVVLDGLDEMDPEPGASTLLAALTGTLPPNVGVVISYWEPFGDWFTKHPSRGQVYPLHDPAQVEQRRETVRAIIRNGVEPRLREWFTRIADDNPFRATVLARYKVWPESVDGDEPLRMVWETVQRLHPNDKDFMTAIGIIAAMHEPVPEEWLSDILGRPDGLWLDFGLTTLPFFFGPMDHDGRNFTFAPRNELVREFVRNMLSTETPSPDWLITRAILRWQWDSEDPARRRYVLDYGLSHAASAGHHEALRILLTDLRFLEEKWRTSWINIPAVIESQKAGFIGKDAESVIEALIRVFMERPLDLQQHDAALPSLAYTYLIQAGLTEEAITTAVHFNNGIPKLRLQQPVLEGRPPAVAQLTPQSIRHSGPVLGCLPLPGGSVLTWSTDSTIRLWDVQSRRLAKVFDHHSAEVTGCVAIGNGTRFVSCSKDRRVVLFDRARPLATRLHDAEVLGIIVRGNAGVTWSADRTVRLWSFSDTGIELVHVLPHPNEIRCCAFSDPWLVTGMADGTISVWEPLAGQLRGSAREHDGPVNVLRSSEQTLISAGQDCTLRVWTIDGGTPQLETTLSGHSLGVVDCALDENARYALSASLDRTLRFWDVVEEKLLHVYEGHSAAVLQCVFLSYENVLSAGADRTVRAWQVRPNRAVGVVNRHEGPIRRLVLENDQLFTCSDDRTVSVIDLRKWLAEPRVARHDPPVTLSSANEPLGLVVSEDQAYVVYRGGALNVLTGDFRGWKGNINGASLRSGGFSVLWTGRGLIAPWTPPSDPGFLISEIFNSETERILDAWSDETEIAAACIDEDNQLFFRVIRASTESQNPRSQLLEQNASQVLGAKFSPDGRYLFSFNLDHSIRVWDLDGVPPTLRTVLSGHDEDILDVTITPDGGELLSASRDGTLRVWDFSSGEELLRMKHDDWVRQVACTPDGRFLVSCSDDRTVRLWDRQAGNLQGIVYGSSPFWFLTVSGERISASDELGRVWFLKLGDFTLRRRFAGNAVFFLASTDRALADRILARDVFERFRRLTRVELDSTEDVASVVRTADVYILLATARSQLFSDSPSLNLALRRGAAGIPLISISEGEGAWGETHPYRSIYIPDDEPSAVEAAATELKRVIEELWRDSPDPK